jgi:hypothetical protein
MLVQSFMIRLANATAPGARLRTAASVKPDTRIRNGIAGIEEEFSSG